MAVTFICWLPLQALLYTMLSLDEQEMAYMNPLRRAIEIPWQDVISVSASASVILIKSGDEIIRVSSFFSGLDKIKGIIKENCPKAFEES